MASSRSNDFFNGLFLSDTGGALATIENVLIGPIIAVLSFVCSVGNVPLAAVRWSGGIGFGGVLAFLLADLILIPTVLAYRKYYGGRCTVRIVALMFVTMVLAALDVLFRALGVIPTGPRPSRADIFGPIAVNYKLFLNVLGPAVFAALFALTRAGATDPTCGMRIDRQKSIFEQLEGESFYFCSEHCRRVLRVPGRCR